MSRTSRTVHFELVGELGGAGLAPELLDQPPFGVDQAVEPLDHVHGDANRASLVGQRAGDRLADPPGGVGRELVAAAVVELLDRPDQPERALLDQVEQRQTATDVALGDRNHQAQVRLDHVLLGGDVAALDALGKRDLLFGAQQRHAADRAQVQPQRVEAGLDRQIDRGALELFEADLQLADVLTVVFADANTGSSERVLGRPPNERVLDVLWRADPHAVNVQLGCGLARGEHLDAVLLQVSQQVVRLLHGQLRVLHRASQRGRRHVSPLVGVGDRSLQLLQLHHGYLRGTNQTLKPLAQLASQVLIRLPSARHSRSDLPSLTLSLLLRCVALMSLRAD